MRPCVCATPRVSAQGVLPTAQEDTVWALLLLPGALLLSGSADASVSVCDVRARAHLQHLRGHREAVQCLCAVSPSRVCRCALGGVRRVRSRSRGASPVQIPDSKSPSPPPPFGP